MKPSAEVSSLGVIGLLTMLAGAVVQFRVVRCGKSEARRDGSFTEPEPAGWRWTAR